MALNPEKVYVFLKKFNWLILAVFLCLLAWDNRAWLAPASENYAGLLGEGSRVRLGFEYRAGLGDLGDCKRNKKNFEAKVGRILAHAGLERGAGPGLPSLHLKVRCSSEEYLDAIVAGSGLGRRRLLTTSIYGYPRLLEALYLARGRGVLLNALKDRELQCHSLSVLKDLADPWAAGAVAAVMAGDKDAFAGELSGCRDDVSDYLAVALRADSSQTNRDKLLPALVAGLDRGDWHKTEIIRLLGELRDPRGLPPLMLMAGFMSWPTTDCDRPVLEALDKIDIAWRTNPQMLKLLPLWLEKLKSAEGEDKRDALALVALAGSDAGVGPILAAMKGPSFPYQFQDCVRALGRSNSRLAVTPLIDSFDEAGSQADRVAIALFELTGQNFGTNKGKWADWWSLSEDNPGRS